jgi:hypothetical protein
MSVRQFVFRKRPRSGQRQADEPARKACPCFRPREGEPACREQSEDSQQYSSRWPTSIAIQTSTSAT